MLPWQATLDQLICVSRSHTHYWYEVGMMKVPLYVYLIELVPEKVTSHTPIEQKRVRRIQV